MSEYWNHTHVNKVTKPVIHCCFKSLSSYSKFVLSSDSLCPHADYDLQFCVLYQQHLFNKRKKISQEHLFSNLYPRCCFIMHKIQGLYQK